MSTLPVVVTARNAIGLTTTANAVINVTDAPVGTIPLSYDDVRFSGNAASGVVTIPANGTLLKKSISEDGGNQSILTTNGSTIDTFRVKSREGVRIAGSGTYNIFNSYIEAVGTGSDHADGIQCYSPGDGGLIRVKNSSLVIGGASNAAFFIADNWVPAKVVLENVVIRAVSGGWTGLKFHADTGGNIEIWAKDVFFVGTFAAWGGNGDYAFLDYGGGKYVIRQWMNVRKATIVNGVLVPGAAMSTPRTVVPAPVP